jgi:rubrerythrin
MQYIYHHYPFYHTNFRNTFDVSLINDIQKAINGEYGAIECYDKLSKMAKTQVEKDQILEIRQDEIRHFEEFSRIYRDLTGRQPVAEIVEKCPDQYKEGVEFAFRDEQETVDFYLDIADKSQNPVIKETFRRAAADEQNHAVWFLYFLLNKQMMTNASRQPTNYGAKGALNATSLTLPQMLTFALQDEHLAQSRYKNVLQTFGDIRTFAQIKEAELRHIYALLPLFEKYQVQVPEDVSQSFVKTPGSVKSAFAASVEGEVDNIAMYEKFLAKEIPNDVRMVFTQLRNASRNHLAAFERGLERNY